MFNTQSLTCVGFQSALHASRDLWLQSHMRCTLNFTLLLHPESSRPRTRPLRWARHKEDYLIVGNVVKFNSKWGQNASMFVFPSNPSTFLSQCTLSPIAHLWVSTGTQHVLLSRCSDADSPQRVSIEPETIRRAASSPHAEFTTCRKDQGFCLTLCGCSMWENHHICIMTRTFRKIWAKIELSTLVYKWNCF